jgi:hypothetical protein
MAVPSSPATPPPTPVTDADKALYQQLNASQPSKDLREAAHQMAILLNATENKSQEINLLMAAVSKISNCDINIMDVSINNMKKVMAGITLRSDNAYPFGNTISPNQVQPIFDEYFKLLMAAIELGKKAQELAGEKS